MAEEERLHPASTNQQPNATRFTTSQPNTEPVKPAQSTEEMEVHHHPHHHGKKTWKSYFWEFLMLFFAVFCGFLAEYQLEHTIEHDREKQYIESMVADMQEDSAKIGLSLAYLYKQTNAFDTLLQTIYRKPYTDSSLRSIYLLQLQYTHSRSPVIFSKRTITQLRNSGGLRLIRNKAASDSIIRYSEDCEQAEAQADYIERVRMGDVNSYSIKLFDNQYILDEKGRIAAGFLQKTSKIALLDNDEKLMKEYANTLTYARGSLRNYILMLKAIQASIPAKMKYLQDKYQ